MTIEIDFNSDEALYIQLRNQIIYGIATRQFHEGDALPSVRQLAEEIGINMHTVNEIKQSFYCFQNDFLSFLRQKYLFFLFCFFATAYPPFLKRKNRRPAIYGKPAIVIEGKLN